MPLKIQNFLFAGDVRYNHRISSYVNIYLLFLLPLLSTRVHFLSGEKAIDEGLWPLAQDSCQGRFARSFYDCDHVSPYWGGGCDDPQLIRADDHFALFPCHSGLTRNGSNRLRQTDTRLWTASTWVRQVSRRSRCIQSYFTSLNLLRGSFRRLQ